jgi:hypothetical protein
MIARQCGIVNHVSGRRGLAYTAHLRPIRGVPMKLAGLDLHDLWRPAGSYRRRAEAGPRPAAAFAGRSGVQEPAEVRLHLRGARQSDHAEGEGRLQLHSGVAAAHPRRGAPPAERPRRRSRTRAVCACRQKDAPPVRGRSAISSTSPRLRPRSAPLAARVASGRLAVRSCLARVHSAPEPRRVVRRRVGDGLRGLLPGLFLWHVRHHLSECRTSGRPSQTIRAGSVQLAPIGQHSRPPCRRDPFEEQR